MEVDDLCRLTYTTYMYTVTNARNIAIPPINPAISPGMRHVGAVELEVGRGITEAASGLLPMSK